MDRDVVGARVRAARTRVGLSQVGLAKAAECDPTTVARIERGEVTVSAEIIARIALALAVTTDSLLLEAPETGTALLP
jgi:transcriptional regulator with XRE-family HTH domain